MSPIPFGVEEIKTPPDANPVSWMVYYGAVVLLAMMGILIYQQSQLSDIHSLLLAREAIFTNITAHESTIIANQTEIIKRMDEHNQEAINRDNSIERGVQHITDRCLNGMDSNSRTHHNIQNQRGDNS